MSWLKHLIKKLDKELPQEKIEIPKSETKREVRLSEKSYREIKKGVSEVSKNRGPLTDEHKAEVIRMIAIYKKNDEILEFLKDQGIEISWDAVDYYRYQPIYKHLIQKARMEFETRISDVEFSSKRRRLEELTDVYWILKQKNVKSAAEVIKIIQEMMEPRKEEVNIQYNQFNSMSDEELKHRMRENIIKLEKLETKEITYAGKIEEKGPTNGQ